MSISDEQAFYEDISGNVVTRSRAIMGGTVYPVANITSVRTSSKASYLWMAVVLAVCAVAFFTFQQWFFGILFGCIAAIVYFKAGHAIYYVVIGTSAREQSALQSSDPQVVRDIASALNKAIAAH